MASATLVSAYVLRDLSGLGETKHFQGYAMVFQEDSHLRVQPLGKEKSFTFEAD